jgi:hypothetical protein
MLYTTREKSTVILSSYFGYFLGIHYFAEMFHSIPFFLAKRDEPFIPRGITKTEVNSAEFCWNKFRLQWMKRGREMGSGFSTATQSELFRSFFVYIFRNGAITGHGTMHWRNGAR